MMARNSFSERLSLLEATLERGRDQDISEALPELEQLEPLRGQALTVEGFDDLLSTADSKQKDVIHPHREADFLSPQELAFLAPTPSREVDSFEPKLVLPIPNAADPLDCPICFTESIPVEEQRALGECGHRYCVECLRHHFTSLIDDGKVIVEDLHCPQPQCAVSPKVSELQTLLTGESFDKYLQFRVLNDLKKDSNAVWCINKQCGQPIIWDPATPHVECPACHTHFCFKCKQTMHKGHPCTFALSKEDQQFIKYVKAQGRATKPCPQCDMPIEKNEGWYG